VLGLRDILGDPDEIRARWTNECVYEVIDEYYEKILIYGEPDIYAGGEAYGLSDRFADRIEYCGFIHFGGKRMPQADARSRLGIGTRPHVVMTAGGGHDTYPMMQFVLSALLATKGICDFELTVIAGPLMPSQQRQDIAGLAARLGARFEISTPHMQTFLSAADAVLTMGGYNTVMESIAACVPTIVIPRTGPSSEQRDRARLFSDLNLVQYIDLEFDDATALRVALDRALNSQRWTTPRLAFNGIATAGSLLAELVPDDTVYENRDVREAVAA
jgi:predicted glycosyltransferase